MRYLKKIICASLIIAGAALLTYDNVTLRIPESQSLRLPPHEAAKPEILTNEQSSQSAQCDESSALFITRPIKNVFSDNPASGTPEDLARTSYEETMQKAKKGDGAAAGALFRLLASCYSLATEVKNPLSLKTPPHCLTVPPELLADRFALIEPFALAGDPNIQTLYALNASLFADLWRTSSDERKLNEVMKLRQNAEKFAIAAASKGSKEAMYYLVGAYMAGTFGPPNFAAAYTYLLPLAEVDPSAEMSTQINSLSQRLTSAQRTSAARRVFGCKSAPMQGTFINPFG